MALHSIIVLGSVNTDLVIRTPHLPAPGETVLGGEFFQASGGKGANQAVAAALASRGSVTFVAAVGNDDFGRARLADLSAAGLDLTHVKQVLNRASGVALILVDERGENLIGVASGANLLLEPADVDRVPQPVFDRASVFLASLESPLAAVHRGLERAKAAGLTTILNPAPADRAVMKRDFLSLVDVITPNEVEATALTGEALPSFAAQQLMALGAKSVVVTLGAGGCLVVSDRQMSVPALPVTAIDTTAAGDAFNGALAVAISEGRTLFEAARFANRAAAIAVTRAGAQPSLPTRDQIERFTG